MNNQSLTYMKHSNIISVTHKYLGEITLEKALENIVINHIKVAERLDLDEVQR